MSTEQDQETLETSGLSQEILDRIDYLNQMKSLELIKKVAHGAVSFYKLLETDYLLIMNSDGNLHWRVISSDKGLGNRPIHFEEIWENSPESAQEEFAYHLDLFKDL